MLLGKNNALQFVARAFFTVARQKYIKKAPLRDEKLKLNEVLPYGNIKCQPCQQRIISFIKKK